MKITTLAAALAAVGLAGCSMMGEHEHGGGMHGGMGGGMAGEHVTLSGSNEVPPVTTSATGSGNVTVGADCTVHARITVSGMQATAAHIHAGAAGMNGKVIVPFTKEGNDTFVAPPNAKLDSEGCAAYKSGQTYVNVHSDAHKGGEIRAQLKGS